MGINTQMMAANIIIILAIMFVVAGTILKLVPRQDGSIVKGIPYFSIALIRVLLVLKVAFVVAIVVVLAIRS